MGNAKSKQDFCLMQAVNTDSEPTSVNLHHQNCDVVSVKLKRPRVKMQRATMKIGKGLKM